MRSKRKKILIVGGEDVYQRIEFANHLVTDYGTEVILCGSGSKSVCENAGFLFIDLNLSRDLSLFSDLTTIFRLIRILFTTKPDIVHFFDTKFGFLGPIAALFAFKLNFKVVRTITGMGKIFSRKTLGNFILKNLYVLLHKIARSKVDVSIFQNKDDEEFFRRNILKSSDKSVIVFGSGIAINHSIQKLWDLEAKDRHKKPLKFSYVGRMLEVKGVSMLISVFSALDIGRCTLTLAGPCYPQEPDGLTRNELDNVKNVNYIGVSNNINELLLDTDVFIYPTQYSEGLPRAVMEAMALGIPVIATPAPGLTDLMTLSQGGIIIEASADGLEEAIYFFSGLSPCELKSMGDLGKSYVQENCSTEAIFREISHVYSSL